MNVTIDNKIAILDSHITELIELLKYDGRENLVSDVALTGEDLDRYKERTATHDSLKCSCHSCEVLPILHEQIRDMCTFLGSDPNDVPCDSWHLRDLIILQSIKIKYLEQLNNSPSGK